MKLNNCLRGLIFVGGAILAGTASAEGSDYRDWWAKKAKGDYFACATTPPVKFDGTIVDAAIALQEAAGLKTLVGAVVGAGLVDTLNSPGPFTVFAPTDDAFGNIPEPILTAIVSDVGLLTAVLTYHVVAGADKHIDPRWVYRRALEVETVQGQTLFFNRNGGPQVNQSNVACQPVHTSNGVVYVIDSVLLPQF
jgi:uncharacterized surface protein with fasciclin (FAS1) repeats